MSSILVYFITFLLSVLLVKNYDKACNKIVEIKSFKYKIQYIMLFLLAITPSVFIAARRSNVGTDYFVYEMIYNTYSSVDFIFFKKLAIEYGYYLINYFSASIFNDFHGVLFISATLTVGIAFAAIIKNRKFISITFAMLIFYLLLYPPMLNGIRQLIAVSIIMYGYSYIVERKLLKFILVVVVASLFHSTALLFLPFYLLVTKFNSKTYILRRVIYFILLIAGVIFMSVLLEAVSELSIFSKYFNVYVAGSDANLLNQIMLRLPIFIPLALFSSVLSKKNKELEFYYLLYFMEIIFIIIGTYYVWAVRLTYYIIPSQIILVPAIVRNIKNKNSRILLSLYFVIWYVIYFAYVFYIKGNDGIFPYN